MAKKPALRPGESPIVPYAQAIAKDIQAPIAALGAASVSQPEVLTPEVAKQRFEAEKAAKAKAAQPAQSSTGPSVQDLLSAILGGQQGQVPKGYADFFTSVLGPLMQQASQLPSTPIPQADLAAMSPQDRAAFDKAYGQQAAGLQEILKGNQISSLAAPGLQQFFGRLTEYQKLIQQLQNALSFIPYSAQGIASMPVQAGSVLAQLGINPAGSALGPGAVPGQAPSLNPGAAITAGG